MAGAVVDLSREPAPATLRTEICVIGSGCGGATAAWDLAAAGHEVVVLEEGADYTAAALTGRDGAMYDQLYMDRGGRSTDDLAISILQGRVLGGGGVINACDVVPASEQVLDWWARRHGLTDLRPEVYRPYTARALADLSAARIPDGLANRANALLRAGTQALGLAGELMMHNRVGCEGFGTCLIGCPADAKRNPRFVAIPGALAAGARFYTRARAVRLETANEELKRITVRTLDPRGYHERGSFEVQARVVVLAANAVGSAQLLLRSGVGNAHVGRHLSLQPQLPVIAVFDEEVRAFAGVPQAWAVTEHERFDEASGLGGFRIEAIMGTPGIVGSLIPMAGVAGKELMTLYPRIAASLLLAPDEPVGTVELTGSGRPRVVYAHPEDHKRRIREAVAVAARVYLAAGARRIIVPVSPQFVIEREADVAKVRELSLEPATAPFLSAHQQGGVRMAPSERDGAADPEGRVYGTRDVYVLDSSGFPSSLSSHTMAPIIAWSHLASARLLTRL